MSKEQPKIIFAPGCFNDFDGTQEELDALIKEVTDIFANSTPEELMAQSREVNLDELMEEDPEFAEALMVQLSNVESNDKRKLQ